MTKKYLSHRVAMVVVLVALGSALIASATEAVAASGNGGGHGGGGMGGGRFGGALGSSVAGGRHFGSGAFGGRVQHGHRARSGAAPFGYYDDWYSGYYDPSTVTPDEQPTYPTAAYPYVRPPRSSCSTQTYKVPSEAGGETSVNVVRC
jgi:hypothetical protein